MGGFGDAFAWQNTLQRAAPLMLTGLAVALPAQAGRVVIGNSSGPAGDFAFRVVGFGFTLVRVAVVRPDTPGSECMLALASSDLGIALVRVSGCPGWRMPCWRVSSISLRLPPHSQSSSFRLG